MNTLSGFVLQLWRETDDDTAVVVPFFLSHLSTDGLVTRGMQSGPV